MNKLKVKSKSHDLLIEIGTEELPSGAVKLLSEALASHIVNQLTKLGIAHGPVRAFATPRRLAVLLHEVAAQQPIQMISRRGPAVLPQDKTAQPSQALLGFAKSCGVEIKALKRMKTEKGEWWFYETTQPGLLTRDLLLPMVQEAIKSLPIAKPMRWGNGDHEFTRPVHWAVLLYGDCVVEGEILNVKTGNLSYGHRFHYPKAVAIPVPCLYESLLADAHVLADFVKRRQVIRQQIEMLASEHHLQAIIPEDLLDEVTSIVEWPKALMVSFDESFLSVPAEALIAAMQLHQKCFALQDTAGQLSPHFITVSNIESRHPQQVILGNEKVMRARLSDAAFFYQQDLKKPLTEYLPATEKVVFQIRLGSLADKTARMTILMDALQHAFDLNTDDARRAVLLSKCDLLTGMVGEFPELQGLMGYYYAIANGESTPVALALHEQYLPKFATDALPGSSLGTALSLVDRLDTLVGFWGIGQKPSGVKDPFKLRRHALALVRMLIKNPVQLTLSALIDTTRPLFAEQLTVSPAVLNTELKTFILERLQSYYQGQGIALEIIYAVRARQDEWLYDLDKRLKALLEFVKLPEAAVLSQACKRVGNILSQTAESELPKSKKIQTNLLTEPAERALYDHIKHIEKVVEPEYVAGQYHEILTVLATLKAPVDAFFDQVMVMVDDVAIKQNRLNILVRLQHILQGVADISQLANLVSASQSGTQITRAGLSKIKQI